MRVKEDAQELLTKVELFAGLDRVDLAKLAAHLDPVKAEDGGEVFHQGEPGDSLYVVACGRFGVFVAAGEGAGEIRVATLSAGDLFGEMSLFTNEPRSATVRAEGGGEALRLERGRFLDLLRREPTISLAIAATLSRRLRSSNLARLESEAFIAARLDQVLASLPDDRRGAILKASVLDTISLGALAAIFGDGAVAVAQDLDSLGIKPGVAAAPVLRALRERLERAEGVEGARRRAERVVERLVGGACWEEALGVLARAGTPEGFARVLARALRAVPALPGDRARRWVERLSDDEAVRDPDLALARASLREDRGDLDGALSILRRALGAAVVAQDREAGPRLSAEIARLSEAGGGGAVVSLGLGREVVAARPRPDHWRTFTFGCAAIGLTLFAAWPGASPQRAFVALLAAAIVLMIGRLVPDFAAGLILVAGWILLGVAKPAEALSGFASKDWLLVLSIYGLAAATARSGVLFRVGLFLIRRLPPALHWQTVTLLATGLLLTPLVPSSTGRASLTAPLSLAVAEALRLPERGRASALLGLGTWVGSGPLMFMFLNGSGTCLLAWGLLPEASRARFTWVMWFVAAAPLGLFVCAGALWALFAMFRPEAVAAPSRERINLQVAVLGPLAAREVLTMAVLILTVAGWVAAPFFGVDLGAIALVGLLATVLAGTFDRRALQMLDWNFLVFFGVVLTIGRLAVSLGLDRAAVTAIDAAMGALHLSPLSFVLAVAAVSLAVRLVMDQDLAVLLGSLTLIPLAPSVGVDPWLTVIALLATSVLWFLPSQTPSYLVAQAGSEGRLFSHAQARRFAFAYTALTLLGLVLSIPYWRLLGLL